MTPTRDSEPIRFYKGTETGIIVEDKDFDKSLFREQYKQAFALIDNIWGFQSSYKEQSGKKIHLGSNLISFCGDRGQGKTSCLTTMAKILEEKDVFEKAKVLFEDVNNYSRLSGTFLVLDMIDPSFFDPRHNLIDLLLGQMYSRLMSDCEINNQNYEELVGKRSKVLQAFAEVKRCLKTVNWHSDTDVYDELEETDNLAAAVKLREKLDNLFDHYLRYYNKKKLLICIDDLDLNMKCGYRMAEEIRNYLSLSNHCVLFVALKVEQMEDVVFSEFNNTFIGIADEELRDMAERYVTKLIPLSQRVLMPTGEVVLEQKIQLWANDAKVSEYATVKEAVVRMIYEKTRYIFVNSPMVSPIVPSNLRELRYLVGLLWDMKDEKAEGVEDMMGDSENKRVFKQYFFQEWTKCLDKKDREFAQAISRKDDPISINKSILGHLRDQLKGIPDLASLVDEKNQEYNISLGDVFYCLRTWEHTISDSNQKNLLFFIRAFYSIKMYDLYNVITSSPSYLFPSIESRDKDKKQPSLYKYDIWLQQQNQLQRLLNGAYFTFNEGELIATDNATKIERDRRKISSSEIGDVLSGFKNLVDTNKGSKKNSSPKESDKEPTNEKKELAQDESTEAYMVDLNANEKNALKLCEFFALTTITKESKSSLNQRQRQLPSPAYIEPYQKKNWLQFDVLSIFNNIVNIRQAYNKLGHLASDDFDFYLFCEKNEDSLLNQMIKECKSENSSTHDELVHDLISDATIRMSEVQMSILDSLIYNKKLDKDKDNGKNCFKIKKLYSRIQGIDIRLYPVKQDQDCHQLVFKFLNPIIGLLNETNEEDFNRYFQMDAVSSNSHPQKVVDYRKIFSKFASRFNNKPKFPAKGTEVFEKLSLWSAYSSYVDVWRILFEGDDVEYHDKDELMRAFDSKSKLIES